MKWRRRFAFVHPFVRFCGVLGAVACVTAVDFRQLLVNSATAALSFLLLILILSTYFGLRESIVASVASMLTYNFFFLSPIGTLTIADPQNWVALFTFLATAMVASHLSSSARQEELQRIYDFSLGLILGKEDGRFANQVVQQIVESFGVENAWFYDGKTGLTSRIDSAEPPLPHLPLSEVATTGRVWRDTRRL